MAEAGQDGPQQPDPQVYVAVIMNLKTGNCQLRASPAIESNRVSMYGLLQMGKELVHRLADEPKKKSDIVIPDLGIFKGLKT